MTSVIIIPVLNNPEWSLRAAVSAYRQVGVDPLTLLLIDQDSATETAEKLARWAFLAEEGGRRVTTRLWRHSPRLPSLAATWNRALAYAWAIGAEDTLVLNNDVEIPPHYYAELRHRISRPLGFLSGVGVRPEQYTGLALGEHEIGEVQLHPDFSAYLITKACHAKYPFDEGFTPAFFEDNDTHRRMLLGDDGRLIGKVNLPFAHAASATRNLADAATRRALDEQISKGSHARYVQKWGGTPGHETKTAPFGPDVNFPVDNDTLRAVAERGEKVSEYLYGQAIRSATQGRPEPTTLEGGPGQPGPLPDPV